MSLNATEVVTESDFSTVITFSAVDGDGNPITRDFDFMLMFMSGTASEITTIVHINFVDFRAHPQN